MNNGVKNLPPPMSLKNYNLSCEQTLKTTENILATIQKMAVSK